MFRYNDVINLLPQQLRVHIDVKVMSIRCHAAKVISTTVGNFIVAMVTDPRHYLTDSSEGAWQAPLELCEMLQDFHIIEKFDFLKRLIYSQTIFKTLS